jgi:ankyrin repeat protein
MRKRAHARGLSAALLTLSLVGAYEPVPLIEAAKRGDHEALRELISQRVNVNATEGDGSTALLWASHKDDLEGVELLLRARADVNAANDLGATPLWAASMNGSLPVVSRLLQAGADPNRALRLGETPLMIASRAGNPRVVEALLATGANPNVKGPRGQTALMWAVAQSHAEVVGALIEGGADIHARSDVWTQMMAQPPQSHPEHQRWFEHGGNSALMFAARVGDLASAKLLVEAGANVNDTNAWGVSVLTMAVYSDFGTLYVGDQGVGAEGRSRFELGGQDRFKGRFQDEGLIDYLLEKGADPDAGDEFTGLHSAILRRDDEMVAKLLAHGADPNRPLGTWTPLRRLSTQDYFFHRAWLGAPPIWLAARFSTPAVVKSLLAAGADPKVLHTGISFGGGGGGSQSVEQREITSPLMAAVGMSRTGDAWLPALDPKDKEVEVLDIVKQLVAAGVDLEAKDRSGNTALGGARLIGYQSVADFLVQSGAQEPPTPVTPARGRGAGPPPAR